MERLHRADDRAERRPQFVRTQRRGGADGEAREALEDEPVTAQRREMILGGLDERDVVTRTDEVRSGDAADRARSDDGEVHLNGWYARLGVVFIAIR